MNILGENSLYSNVDTIEAGDIEVQNITVESKTNQILYSLPTSAPTTGQHITSNGSTELIWSTPSMGTGDLLASGIVPLTNNWDSGDYDIRANTLTVDGGGTERTRLRRTTGGVNYDLYFPNIPPAENNSVLKINISGTSNFSKLFISEIGNVVISGLVNNHVLKWTGSDFVNGFLSLSEIGNVVISGLVNNHVLKWTGSNFVNAFLSLSDLGDYSPTAPGNGDVIIYNSGVYTNSQLKLPLGIGPYNTNILKFDNTGLGTWSTFLLNDLSDVIITSAQADDVITRVGTDWVNKQLLLDTMNDVTLNNVQTNDVLKWSGSTWVNSVVPPTSLTALTDTSFSGLASGDILTYNGSNWINRIPQYASLFYAGTPVALGILTATSYILGEDICFGDDEISPSILQTPRIPSLGLTTGTIRVANSGIYNVSYNVDFTVYGGGGSTTPDHYAQIEQSGTPVVSSKRSLYTLIAPNTGFAGCLSYDGLINITATKDIYIRVTANSSTSTTYINQWTLKMTRIK